MTPAPKKSEETVTWRVFQGTLANIEAQVMTADLPKNWGSAELVKQFILNHVPSGPGWKGNIRVTAYRTPLNDNGTGTAYLSVHWEPQGGRD